MVNQKREEFTSLACPLPDDHLIILGQMVSLEQWPMTLAGFVVGGTVAHNHKGFLTLVLRERGIISLPYTNGPIGHHRKCSPWLDTGTNCVEFFMGLIYGSIYPGCPPSAFLRLTQFEFLEPPQDT